MRTAKEAVAFALEHVGHNDPKWQHHCLEFVRTCYGVSSWGPSALELYKRIPHHELHDERNVHSIPAGAVILYPDLGGEYGHVTIAVGSGACVGTDYDGPGTIAKAPADLPRWRHSSSVFWTLWSPTGTITL